MPGGRCTRRRAARTDAVGRWLWGRRRLTLNPAVRKSRRGEVVSTTRPVAFLGYRVSRTGIRPGKRMMKRMKQRFRALRHESPERVARSIESYRGWIGFG